jgi:hypothetical protein
MNANTRLFLSVILFINCSSPQERAINNPNTPSNLCPNLGILSENSLNPESIFLDRNGLWRVSVITSSGQIKDFNKDYFLFAKDIKSQDAYTEFLDTFKEICNSKPPFNKEIKYVQDEERAKKEWELVNKKSFKSILSFQKTSTNEALRKESEMFKYHLLDQKVKDHLVSKFPFMKKVIDKEVIYTNGETSEYKLHELYRSTVLSKQMQTGKKMPLVLEEKDGRIIWTVENNNNGVILYFREHNGKVALDKIIQKRGMLLSTVAGQAVDFLAMGIFNESTNFPDDEDLDEDMIK